MNPHVRLLDCELVSWLVGRSIWRLVVWAVKRAVSYTFKFQCSLSKHLLTCYLLLYRMVLDSIRTLTIWMFSVGVGWQDFYLLQLLGNIKSLRSNNGYLPTFLSIYLFIYLSDHSPACLILQQSTLPSYLSYLAAYIHTSIYLSIHPSICLSIYPTMYISNYQSAHLPCQGFAILLSGMCFYNDIIILPGIKKIAR